MTLKWFLFINIVKSQRIYYFIISINAAKVICLLFLARQAIFWFFLHHISCPFLSLIHSLGSLFDVDGK